MKKKILTFAVLLTFLFLSIVNIGLGEAANYDVYPDNFIQEINMPGHAVERLTLLMEKKVSHQLNMRNKYYPEKEFNFSIREYMVKPYFIENEFSGSWDIICEKKDMEERLQLEQDSLIIMIKDQYILARSNNKLLYLPVKEGQIFGSGRKIIYQFDEEFMKRVEYIRNEWSEM